MGPQYAIERNPEFYINELIIDTENAIRHLHNSIQNTFHHLAAKKIKQIKASNRHNTMHKRHQYNINQIKKILQHNNLTVAKANKNKAIVIMDKEVLRQKIDTFIQENNIMMLSKDPTESYQKLLQKTMQKCEDLVEKNTCKYLLNIKPTAPRINAYIKTHKENKPVRPVIDNTQALSYKIAKFLNKRIYKSTQYIHHIEFT
jgi:DNA-binding transcriptional MerR regulator